MFQSIELENLLSFKHVEFELKPLNVLIGANASGKSNLVRVFTLLRSLPKEMWAEIAEGGGVRGWINQKTKGTAKIAVALASRPTPYSILFRELNQSYEITHETWGPSINRAAYFSKLPPVRSILAQTRHAPEIGVIADAFEGIRLYRELRTGPGASARFGVSASGLGEYLVEDGGNLAAVLGKMKLSGWSERVNDYLKRFFDDFTEVFVYASGGISQIYVREKDISTR